VIKLGERFDYAANEMYLDTFPIELALRDFFLESSFTFWALTLKVQ
jgi:hypothetical protein